LVVWRALSNSPFEREQPGEEKYRKAALIMGVELEK
jgi:hypothetical protein